MALKPCPCRLCRQPIELVQELRYLVELQVLDQPAVLECFRQLPYLHGKPLRVCQACQGRINADPVGFRKAVAVAHARVRKELSRQRSGLVTALGVLSVGWFFASFLGGSRA